jgi:hypothetical protein
MDELLAVLRDTRSHLARPDNDFSWSSWQDQAAALREMDELIATASVGPVPKKVLDVLYLPTGPIQEVSLSSGWGDEFLELAQRYDNAVGAGMPSRQSLEVVLCVFAIATTFVAWLFGAIASICWTLAAFGLICSGVAIFLRGRRGASRSFPLGLFIAVLILVAFALPIWNSHYGEPPPVGGHPDKHAHQIWQLGHVH